MLGVARALSPELPNTAFLAPVAPGQALGRPTKLARDGVSSWPVSSPLPAG